MPLNPHQVADAIRGGVNQKLADGHNLYLVVKNGKGFWVHQFRDGAVIRSKGLGSAADVTPAQARRAREAFTVARREGLELPGVIHSHKPRGDRFSDAADAYLSNHADEWGERHQAGLKALVRMHAAPLANAPVNRITTDQVADILRPIWNGPGNNRGSRLRRLIESILRSKDVEPNPATWPKLREKLSKKVADVKSKASMPAADVPTFVRRLDMASIEDRAIKFVLLTCTRRQETVGATWREFDLNAKKWTIPAERMKTRKQHDVPLTDEAIACLGKPGAPNDLVFPPTRGAALGHDALSLRNYGLDYTLHGFRSSLSSWAEEKGYPTNVIQLMLAHRKKDDQGKPLPGQDLAYLRATRFDERRKLHEAWAAYACG